MSGEVGDLPFHGQDTHAESLSATRIAALCAGGFVIVLTSFYFLLLTAPAPAPSPSLGKAFGTAPGSITSADGKPVTVPVGADRDKIVDLKPLEAVIAKLESATGLADQKLAALEKRFDAIDVRPETND